MDKLILEEIQRMNLLSKYDNSKTLGEQLVSSKPSTFMNEAAPTAPNTTASQAPASNSSQLPPELKNIQDIKDFQDWLDDNVSNWATGYKGGKIRGGVANPGFKSGGYGRFGPRTQKAWSVHKDTYLKYLKEKGIGGTTSVKTDTTVNKQIVEPTPEVEGEDNTQIISPNDDEYGGGATTPSAEQPAKVETPPTNDQAVTLQGNPKSAITTGQTEKPTSAIYGQEYKASDGKTYVWSGTEYKVKA